jgi:hypothetical protein
LRWLLGLSLAGLRGAGDAGEGVGEGLGVFEGYGGALAAGWGTCVGGVADEDNAGKGRGVSGEGWDGEVARKSRARGLGVMGSGRTYGQFDSASGFAFCAMTLMRSGQLLWH